MNATAENPNTTSSEPATMRGTKQGAALSGSKRAKKGTTEGTHLPRVILVGNPNVGKSVVFNALTGAYVVVSNYPGTTVTIDKGKATLGDRTVEIVDTPGMYSLVPVTGEEQVGRDILFSGERQDETGSPDVVVHVMDAKNISRMLPFTLQLLEAGLPLILVLNLADEAKQRGVIIDADALEQELGIPVIPTVATAGEGIDRLKQEIEDAVKASPVGKRNAEQRSAPVLYGRDMEQALVHLSTAIAHTPEAKNSPQEATDAVPSSDQDAPRCSRERALALMLLQGDETLEEAVFRDEMSHGTFRAEVETAVTDLKKEMARPATYHVGARRQRRVEELVERSVRRETPADEPFSERISRMLMEPITGIPIFLLVVIGGLYFFVGQLGAGIVVDFIEVQVFEERVNPGVDGWLDDTFGGGHPVSKLIGGDYGIVTMALRYAIAIVLPIVGAFFFMFSLIEDSGYLPRLAMLINRAFRRIGLNGRAVIPMVLGFGCSTMATVVTRTQESKRERILTTFLLALTIPCSAQLGIIVVIMEGHLLAMLIWLLTIIFVMLFIGYLTAQVLPGEPAVFFMELPPLRVPGLSNVLRKTYTRMVWYFKEVVPLFVLASIIIWIADLTGLFDAALIAMVPLMHALGLPGDAAEAFLYGFFRRDYGAAGLFDMRDELSGRQLLVSAVTLTLFIPCVAQLSIMLKERGKRVTAGMVAFIIPFSFGVGFLLNQILEIFNINP